MPARFQAYFPRQLGMLRLEVLQDIFVLLVTRRTQSNVLREIPRIVQLSHAVDEVLLFL